MTKPYGVWFPLHGEGATKPPIQTPVLVRTERNPVRHYHVAIWLDGNWRMSGAQDRLIYDVSDWAWTEVDDAA